MAEWSDRFCDLEIDEQNDLVSMAESLGYDVDFDHSMTLEDIMYEHFEGQVFRICDECGGLMFDGMTNLEDVYLHECCFEAWQRFEFPGGHWHFEDDSEGGSWHVDFKGEDIDTGIFYTDWE